MLKFENVDNDGRKMLNSLASLGKIVMEVKFRNNKCPSISQPATETIMPKRKRREPIRLLKINENNGHHFVARFFPRSILCSICNEFLW